MSLFKTSNKIPHPDPGKVCKIAYRSHQAEREQINLETWESSVSRVRWRDKSAQKQLHIKRITYLIWIVSVHLYRAEVNP